MHSVKVLQRHSWPPISPSCHMGISLDGGELIRERSQHIRALKEDLPYGSSWCLRSRSPTKLSLARQLCAVNLRCLDEVCMAINGNLYHAFIARRAGLT